LFLVIVNEMSGQDKSSDAEEIFTEFEKSKAEKEKKEEPASDPKLEEPEPQLESTEPEPQLEEPKSEPQLEEPKSEPQLEEPKSEPQLEEPKSEPQLEEPKSEPQQHIETPQEVSDEVKPKAVSSESTGGETAIRDVIYVGTKPIMTYVNATLTQLSAIPTVTIKARGKRITQAVDVSQMIVKRMNSVGYEVSDVRIASDYLTSQDGKKRSVSTMEIDVTKVKDN